MFIFLHVDTLSCDALLGVCQYGNISEHLIDGANLTEFWKRAKIFIPFATDYKFVSGYYYITSYCNYIYS